MGILVSNELKEELKKELKKTSRRVDIITAFCKIDSLKYLDEYIPKDVIKRLLIRFRSVSYTHLLYQEDITKHIK